MDHILAEGLEARFARHAAMAARVQEWALRRELGLYAPQGYRSKTVTTINNDEIDYAGLSRFLVSREMRIANGYGALKGKTFRIAHMGETSEADIEDLLSTIEEYLAL
jgi:aspartate aminotransferase-like enzyme